MYGLIALGFHVTYVVSDTVNFAQGSSMMLGAVLGYTFAVTLGWPLPLAVALALLLCALFGLVVERALVRPFVERGSNAWLMATVARRHRARQRRDVHLRQGAAQLPVAAGADSRSRLFGAGVYPLQLLIPVVGLGSRCALQLVVPPHAAAARRCWRWCRTAMPRG